MPTNANDIVATLTWARCDIRNGYSVPQWVHDMVWELFVVTWLSLPNPPHPQGATWVTGTKGGWEDQDGEERANAASEEEEQASCITIEDCITRCQEEKEDEEEIVEDEPEEDYIVPEEEEVDEEEIVEDEAEEEADFTAADKEESHSEDKEEKEETPQRRSNPRMVQAGKRPRTTNTSADAAKKRPRGTAGLDRALSTSVWKCLLSGV